MCWPWCCRLEMSIVQVLPFQGREAMKCFSVKFMGFSVDRSLSRAKRPWKSNLQQHLLLSAAMEELGGKVCNVAAGRNICRKNKGWMRLRSKKKSKEELTRNCIFYPIVEIPSDAWDVTFSYSLVYSLSMFLSEGVKQRKHKRRRSPVCYSVLMLPLHWISSAHQFDVDKAAETSFRSISVHSKGSVYY